MAQHQIRRISENVYFKLILPPTANPTDGSFPASGSYINVYDWARFAFIIAVGATDDTAITAQVAQATSINAAGKKNVSGAAITGTVLAGTNDNKWAIIEVDQERLDVANDFCFVTLDVAATGGTASAMAVFFVGIEPRVKPPVFGSDLAEQIFVDG